jgi:hypothetical protein
MIRNLHLLLLLLAVASLVGACGDEESKTDKDTSCGNGSQCAEVVVPADIQDHDDATAGDVTDNPDLPGSGDLLDGDDLPGQDLLDTPEVVENLAPGDVKRIKGRVVDQDGQPIAGLFVQPCTYSADSELCHKANTDADGHWQVNFMPAKSDLDGIHVRFVTEDYTPSACYWDMAEVNLVDNVIDFTEPFVIYDQGPALASIDFGIDVPTHVEGAGVDFTVAADEWFPGIFEPVDIKIMRFPLDDYVPCFLDDGNLPDALFSMVPDWISFSTPGGIPATFENTEELPAGSKVSFFVLGALDTQITPLEGDATFLHTGDWFNIGTGTVRQDGSVITTDVGAGLPGIGWVGYKAQ